MSLAPTPNPIVWTLLGIVALLAFASALAEILARRAPDKDYGELKRRIASWWVMVGLLAAAFALGSGALILALALLSFLALKEYLSLIPGRRADRRVLFWAYLAIPVQAWLIWENRYGLFAIFVPVYMFMVLPARMMLIGVTSGFLRALGTLHWGLMATVYALGHAAFLVNLPRVEAGGAAGRALLLYFLILVALNDVAQYTWGKTMGRHKVVPRVSPKKTWEGLIGGVATTVLVGALLAPVLTPLVDWQRVAAPLLIGIGGFVSDVVISAIKRDLGIKDSGSLIPGHGGVLDRVDSMIFTAPLFFHFVRFFHG